LVEWVTTNLFFYCINKKVVGVGDREVLLCI
jgi:hypothetical protein